MQFLHQVFSVTALQLYDALLKCVVTEVVLFSIIVLRHDISQGSVPTHLRRSRICSNSAIRNFLLILTVKKFENWSISVEVIRRTKLCQILGYPILARRVRTRVVK